MNYLINNFKLNENDKKSLLNFGPLERYQFELLLNNNKNIIKRTSSTKDIKISFYRFFYAFGNLQDFDKSEIKKLQENLEIFKTSKENLIYVILLGITNHWVFLILQ